MNARIRIGGSFDIGASIALIILPLLASCSPKEATRAEPVRPVKTMLVMVGGEPQVRLLSGRVGAMRRAELAFLVSGVLASLPVKEGQVVAKGAVIAQLRTDEFEARLTTLRGQLDQSRATLRSLEAGERPEEQRRREAALRAAEARLANARIESERATNLSRAGARPRAEADRAQTAYRVAQEEEQSARQELEMGTVGREEDIEARRGEVRGLEGRVVEAKLQLDDCTLRAPYDGVVAQRLVEERQNVRAMEPVVRFQDVEELDIVVDVPETVMVADIRTADIVQMVAEVSGAPGIQFPVTIREIAKEADPTTQTFRVRAAMEAPKNVQILPGMTATVTVTFHRASILGNQLLVPVSAVMTPAGGGGPVVWVVGPAQTVSPRPVKVGAVTGGRIEIVEGLQPGDRIVVAGVTQLREGQKVRDLGNALGGGSS
jgi:RND family efflux transporter MFP subunit